jgi:hypothetical protein
MNRKNLTQKAPTFARSTAFAPAGVENGLLAKA